MLQLARLPSRPDIVLLEDSEQGPARGVLGVSKSSRLHLVEVTFTTEISLADRVAVKTRQHEQMCNLLREAGWQDVVLDIFVVGHTGVMGNSNRGILEALGVRPSHLKEALQQVAVLGCRYSCDILKPFGVDTGHLLILHQMRPALLSIYPLIARLMQDQIQMRLA